MDLDKYKPKDKLVDRFFKDKQRLKQKSDLRKRKPKISSKKFLLPQVTGLRWISDKEFELVTEGGCVDIHGEFWSTEKLADELFYCVATKEAEPELVTLSDVVKDTTVDLLERYESSKTLLYKKYIIRAECLASAHRKGTHNIFLINLVDLPKRIKAELLDLQTANSRTTLSRVLYSAVARIFALASLAWFYQSAREEIEVLLQP